MPIDFQRIQSVFQAVAELPWAERAAVLERECNDDVELRRRVEALLQAHDDPGQLPAAEPQPTGAYVPAIEPGQVFDGRYKLREKLGEGGMGVVFVADQTAPVQRRVALKIIRAGLDTHRLLARFEQERQALALMDHPNIAKVFDAGVDPAQRPYFAMELVKGLPLTKYCDDAKLSPRERLELFIPVCQAVQHAHQKGIIHRDLKPSNILVGLYDGRPVPKVIDFGVAKATGPRLTEQSVYTEVGSIIGTFEYMSPEQAELNNLDIDTRSDIYALGVILYELLTGAVPFSRKELEKAGLAEMLRVIKEAEPPKPSTKLSHSGTLPSIAAHRRMEPHKLTALVHGELDWIVMKCLEKERSRRYETANGLAMDLQRFLHDEAVLAGPPSAAYRLRKSLRRHQGPAVATALVLLALIAGIIGTAWQAVRATSAERAAIQERDRAEQEKGRAEENFKLARNAVDKYFTKVSESPSMRAVGLENLRRDLLMQAKEFYERFIREQPAEKNLQTDLGKAYGRLGNICTTLGDTAAAEENYAKAIALFEELSRREPDNPEHQHNLAESQRNLGAMFRDTSRPEMAKVLLERAVATAKAVAAQQGNEPEYQRGLALAYNALGFFWQHAHDLERGEDAYQQAIAVGEKLIREHPDESGRHRGELATSAGNLADVYRLAARHDEAKASSQRAVQILEKLSTEFPGEGTYRHLLTIAYHQLGSLQQDTGHPGEAEMPLQRAVAISERLTREHPDVLDYIVLLATSYSRLARLANHKGQPRAVLTWSDKGIETLQRVLDKEPRHSQAAREIKDLRTGRAVALAQMGDHAQAAKVAEAMAKQEGLTPVDVYNLACMYSRCSEAAAKDATLSAVDRARLKEQHANRAMEFLRQALAKGFKDTPPLSTDPDFNALREREDFKKLLEQLEAKAVPKTKPKD